MDKILERYRDLLQQHRQSVGRRGPYPKKLKELAVQFTQEAQRQRVPVVNIAQTLDIDPNTVLTWARQLAKKRDGEAGIVPVRIADDASMGPITPNRSAVASREFAPRTVAVELPTGIRITGIPLDDVAMLLRDLA